MEIEIARKIAEEKGTTLTGISKELGLGGSAITAWEKHDPSIGRVQKVAQYLGVTVSTLLGEVDEIGEKYAVADEKTKRIIRILLDLE